MISVCMATYNGEPWIAEQLQSILAQLGDNDEVVINDDVSTDHTVSIIKSMNDDRVRLEVNSVNLGYTKNFERALRRSQGDIVFLSDQDDVWLPGRVEAVRSKLKRVDFVVTDATVVDESLSVIELSHFAEHNVRSGFLSNFIATRYIGACMAFSRKVLDRALPFPPNDSLCAHDYWLALIAEAYFRVDLEPNQLLLYRRHGKNASSGGSYSHRTLAEKVAARLYCGFNLMQRGIR